MSFGCNNATRNNSNVQTDIDKNHTDSNCYYYLSAERSSGKTVYSFISEHLNSLRFVKFDNTQMPSQILVLNDSIFVYEVEGTKVYLGNLMTGTTMNLSEKMQLPSTGISNFGIRDGKLEVLFDANYQYGPDYNHKDKRLFVIDYFELKVITVIDIVPPVFDFWRGGKEEESYYIEISDSTGRYFDKDNYILKLMYGSMNTKTPKKAIDSFDSFHEPEGIALDTKQDLFYLKKQLSLDSFKIEVYKSGRLIHTDKRKWHSYQDVAIKNGIVYLPFHNDTRIDQVQNNKLNKGFKVLKFPYSGYLNVK